MERADVVIVGGGLVGVCIAYHLARMGSRRVLLLERNALGFGITMKAAGGFRQQFASELHVRLSRESLLQLLRFPEETGWEIPYRADGYLVLADEPTGLDVLRRSAAMQRRAGADARFLAPVEAASLAPGLRAEGILGAVHTPEDGHFHVQATVQGYAQTAHRLGVRLREGVSVTGLLRRRGRVVGVATSEGPVVCGTVVNAAGVFAAAVGAMAGLRLPVLPFRRDTWLSRPRKDVLTALPTVMHLRGGWTLRREGDSVVMSGERSAQSDYGTLLNRDAIAEIQERISRLIPDAAGLSFARGWAGSLDMSPDHHPLLGEHPDAPGLFHACGFSGHGFMHAPEAGRIAAAWVLAGAAPAPWEALSVSRFERGQALEEAFMPLGAFVGGAGPALLRGGDVRGM